MGNKSKVKKDNSGRDVSRIVAGKGLDGKIHERKVKWDEKRDLVHAGMAGAKGSWPGMKEKRAGARVGETRVVYPSGSTTRPKRNKPAAKPEINRSRQPWQKKAPAP